MAYINQPFTKLSINAVIVRLTLYKFTDFQEVDMNTLFIGVNHSGTGLLLMFAGKYILTTF